MKLSMEMNHAFAFARLGNRELHVERHAVRAPEGWLSVVRTGFEGEAVLNLGRWAVHFVNHRRPNRTS